MEFLFNFIIGFTGAFIGALPPGLLNMYAAKISMREGRNRALLFSAGVCLTLMIQMLVSLLAASYIQQNPDVVSVLQKVALGIFISLTVYFFFIAKDSRPEIADNNSHSGKNRFFTGMFIAALNLLPIPYWVYISITFSVFGWFSFAMTDLAGAVLGSGLGALIALLGYVHFFRPREESRKMKVNMNYIIGIITGIISVITFIKIIREL